LGAVTHRALLLAALVLVACGHKPPYTRANRPTPELLLQSARPQLDAVTVSDATITLNRVARGDLAMLAQTPSRFRASVSKAGNELVTLAFTEKAYALRYLLDDLPTGFYTGPADPCAVEAMLGVPLSYEDLVAAVLGGAPVLANHEVLEQQWDRKQGHEKLVIRNDRFIEELQFEFVGGTWRYSGGGLWERSGDARGRWLWSLEHDDYEPVGTAVLPGKTEVRSPGARRRSIAIIRYEKRDPNPTWATHGGENGGENGGEDEGGEDEGGWEGEDEDGWENAEEPDADASPGAVVAAPEAPAGAAAMAEKSNVPAVFQLDGAGLAPRGDLCR
jgi:hypothetical protein